MDSRPHHEPEAVLEHTAWMRALALSLLGDASAADDVVQDASIAALRHPPAAGVALEPWLSRVVRHFALRRRRGEARRHEREARVAVPDVEPSSSDTLERLDLQQTMVDAVRAVDEPLRTTIVLRYFEGLTSAEIARLQRVPPGTVRWRLKRGLDQLRERLDKRFGSRTGWSAALAPFALRDTAPVGTSTAASSGILKGVLAVSGTQIGLAVAAAALVIGALWWSVAGEGARATAEAVQALPSAVVAAQDEPTLESDTARAPALLESGSGAPASAAKELLDQPAQAVATSDAKARVAARFVDAHGAPWNGVELTARANWDGDEAPVYRALSGVDGSVELEVPLEMKRNQGASWNYDLVASRSGCAAVKRAATLSAGQTAHLGDVVLNAGVRVFGRVVDEGGGALAATAVGVAQGELDDDEGRMRRKGAKAFDLATSTRSTDDGTFVIDGVEPGSRRFWAHAEGLRYSWSAPLDVPPDRDLTEVELVVTPLLVSDRIEGRVVGPRGEPVPGAHLMYSCRSPKKGFRTYVPVDEAGRFALLIDFDDARYDFTAHDNNDRLAATTTTDVLPGTLDVELRMKERRVLTVRVLDAAQQSIDGAQFEIEQRISGFTSTGETTADVHGAGSYEISVPDDEFRLTVSARRFRPARLGPWTPATLPNPLEVVLQRAPIVRGRVVADGKPVAGASISLLSHDRDANGTVNGFRCFYMHDMDRSNQHAGADGSFELDANFRDAFWIRAEMHGWTCGEVGPIELAQLTEDASFEVELTRGGAIEGRVLLPDGRDGAGTIVALNHGDGAPRSLRAGPQGVFRVDGLAPGHWQVLARDEEIDPGTTSYGSIRAAGPIAWSCEVAAGRTTRFDLDLTAK